MPQENPNSSIKINITKLQNLDFSKFSKDENALPGSICSLITVQELLYAIQIKEAVVTGPEWVLVPNYKTGQFDYAIFTLLRPRKGKTDYKLDKDFGLNALAGFRPVSVDPSTRVIKLEN